MSLDAGQLRTAIRSRWTTNAQIRRPVYEAGTAPEDRKFRPDVQGLRAVAVAARRALSRSRPGFWRRLCGRRRLLCDFRVRDHRGPAPGTCIHRQHVDPDLLRPPCPSNHPRGHAGHHHRGDRLVCVSGPITGGQTAGDARWASVFLVNIHFATGGTNYLASQLPPSVLQNFWSLAVEEQFYLVYPTVFLGVSILSRRFPLRRRLGIALCAAVAASFVTSIVQTSANPTSAYFSPFTRGWELPSGGIVAVGTVRLRRLPATFATALSWIGLGSILVAAYLHLGHRLPRVAVALPVVGAALIIAGGVAEPAYGVERLLRLRPFQWMGLVSYSFYLWHWPILTLVAQRRGAGNLYRISKSPVADRLVGTFHSNLPTGQESDSTELVTCSPKVGQRGPWGGADPLQRRRSDR